LDNNKKIKVAGVATIAVAAVSLIAFAGSFPSANDDHQDHQAGSHEGHHEADAATMHHDMHRQPGDVGKPPEITRSDTDRQDELPIDVTLDDRFSLIDQDGQRMKTSDLEGQMSLLFFGYANCEGVCLMALPNLADTTALLEADGIEIQPVMITIDPERDTPAAMKSELQDLHPEFIGLTGSDQELSDVMTLFNVQKSVLFHDPEGAPIYRHGTFVYLFDHEAELLTVFPPILDPEDMATIVRGYIS